MIITAGCAFLATLARYDGWALLIAAFCCIALVGWMKRQKLLHIQANLFIFGILGSLGIGLWLLWNKLIFGDPLYFQKGLYSSQAQQHLELVSGKLFSYHNLWQSIRFYTIDASQTIGMILFILAFVGVILVVLKYKFKPVTLAALLFLTPFPFYIAALYGGQAIIWVPGANPPDAHLYMYNVRYGAQMVIPAALFMAIFVERVSSIFKRRFYSIGRLVLIGVVLAQSLLIASQGIIALQDSQFSYACGPQKIIKQYLSEHYNGGKILQDVYASQFDASDAGIDFKNVIYEGDGQFWSQALQSPASSVDWVVVRPGNSLDLVAQRLQEDPNFLSQFTLVVQQTDGILLYHHVGRPALPTRPGLPIWNGEHYSCA